MKKFVHKTTFHQKRSHREQPGYRCRNFEQMDKFTYLGVQMQARKDLTIKNKKKNVK